MNEPTDLRCEPCGIEARPQLHPPVAMRNALWLAGAALIAAHPLQAQRASVQPDTTHHALAIPARAHPLTCRPVRPTAGSTPRSGTSAWEFEVGAQGPGPVALRPRQITAAFDSAGAPIILVDMVNLVPVRSDVVTVRFPSTGPEGQWSATRFDSASLAFMDAALAKGGVTALQKAIPKPEKRDITDAERQQATVLARWLWQRRCAQRPASTPDRRTGR